MKMVILWLEAREVFFPGLHHLLRCRHRSRDVNAIGFLPELSEALESAAQFLAIDIEIQGSRRDIDHVKHPARPCPVRRVARSFDGR
jgi:hypothetical protein